MQAVATQWKHDEIAQLEEYLAAPVVALVDVSGIPARQMMEMRKSLRERGVRVRMSRNRLLRRAIDSVAAKRPGLEKLADAFRKEQLSLLTGEGSPFTIFRLLKEAQTQAPAKGGETASTDIVIEKGPTPFPAGPIVGQFQQAGFPAHREGANRDSQAARRRGGGRNHLGASGFRAGEAGNLPDYDGDGAARCIRRRELLPARSAGY